MPENYWQVGKNNRIQTGNLSCFDSNEFVYILNSMSFFKIVWRFWKKSRFRKYNVTNFRYFIVTLFHITLKNFSGDWTKRFNIIHIAQNTAETC